MREVSAMCAAVADRLILAKCAVQCMRRPVVAVFGLCMLPGPWKWSPVVAAFASHALPAQCRRPRQTERSRHGSIPQADPTVGPVGDLVICPALRLCIQQPFR